MRKILNISIIFIVSILGFFGSFGKVAAEEKSIVINELMPNPIGTDTGKEWVELHNPTSFPINLDGWVLKDKTSSYSLNGLSISVEGYLVIFPTISLNNTDETITLTNNAGYEDIVSYTDSIEGISIERINYRCNGFLPHVNSHTQGLINSNFDANFCNPESEEPEIVEPQIFLNELLPDPDGSDTGNEWVELYNPNDFSVNLKDWQIGVGSKNQIIEDVTIEAKGFQIVNMKISLTNTSAEISLISPQKNIEDSFHYSETETGKSWARKTDGEGEWIILEMTKGESNKVILQETTIGEEKSIKPAIKKASKIELNLTLPGYFKIVSEEIINPESRINTIEVNKLGFAGMFAVEIVIYWFLVLKKEERLNLWHLVKTTLQF